MSTALVSPKQRADADAPMHGRHRYANMFERHDYHIKVIVGIIYYHMSVLAPSFIHERWTIGKEMRAIGVCS